MNNFRNRIKQLFCKHNFIETEIYEHRDPFAGLIPIIASKCSKCGYSFKKSKYTYDELFKTM